MVYTYTTTETWSQTHARYVAGKVMADLRQMQQAYGKPSNTLIDNFIGELVQLLNDEYLHSVAYGFVRGCEWLPATLRYDAVELGSMIRDDRSGSVKRGVDISGADWCSYLIYSDKFWQLTPAAQVSYKAALPVNRISGPEPNAKGGWAQDKSYISGGGGVRRSILGGLS